VRPRRDPRVDHLGRHAPPVRPQRPRVAQLRVGENPEKRRNDQHHDADGQAPAAGLDELEDEKLQADHRTYRCGDRRTPPARAGARPRQSCSFTAIRQ
jgi:hypothetical protein